MLSLLHRSSWLRRKRISDRSCPPQISPPVRMSSAVSAKLVSDNAQGLAASFPRIVTKVVLEWAAAVTRIAGG
jgi:hypothetical protein